MKFTKEPLEKFIFVVQTSGSNAKIKGVYTGLESFVNMALFNGQIALTKKSVVYVFRHSDEKYVGFIKRGEYDIPTSYIDEDGSEFKDFYTVTFKEAYPNG